MGTPQLTDTSNRVPPRPAATERSTPTRGAVRHGRAHPTSAADPARGSSLDASLPDVFAVAVASLPADADQGGGDDEGGNGSSRGAIIEANEFALERRLDLRLQRVGVTIATLCKSAQSQTSWHARIPLDPELLAGTVLHLAYSPTMVTVRFETTEWSARELLSPRLPSFEQILVEMLPSSCQVFVSVT